jgi:hypothetical protein
MGRSIIVQKWQELEYLPSESAVGPKVFGNHVVLYGSDAVYQQHTKKRWKEHKGGRGWYRDGSAQRAEVSDGLFSKVSKSPEGLQMSSEEWRRSS